MIPVDRMAFSHGLFFLCSGLWPVFNIRSFEKPTGPKTDDWLVKTVGLLIAVTGSALIRAAFRVRKGESFPRDLSWIARGQSLSLAAIGLFYSLAGRISKVYLLDATVQTTIAVCWSKTDIGKRRASDVGHDLQRSVSNSNRP
jgi:hypothetical protein